MSRELWEALLGEGTDGEDAPSAELRALARAAARRRAATELAEDEYQLGLHASVTEEEAAPPLRLAAQDRPERPEPVRWQAGPFVLHTWQDDQGSTWIQQDSGPSGTTLELDGEWTPLEPGRARSLGRTGPLPARLRMHDATGRVWKLEPAPA